MSTPASSAAAELSSTPYEWVRCLARGAMGEVHVVEHRELRMRAALKLLRADLADTTVVERLRAEARLLTFVSHPNLVKVLDFGWTESRRPYLVSELLEGETLGEKLKRERRLPPTETADVAMQVLRGLAAVHPKGIVHRDVKPDNLFVTEVGKGTVVKILDFGVAKILSAAVRHAAGRVEPTEEGMLIGTPSYLAPEQITAKEVDARADVYAVGGLIFRMLEGNPPFVRDTQLEIFRAHLFDAPRFADDSSGDVRLDRLRAVALRALEKSPGDRFASAETMLLAIQAAIASREVPEVAAAVAVAPTRTVRMSPPAQETERLPAPRPSQPTAEPPSDTYLDALRRKRTRPVQPLAMEAPLIADDSQTIRRPALPQLPARTERAPRDRLLLAIVVLLAMLLVATMVVAALLAGAR